MSVGGPTVVDDDPGDLRHAERGNRQPYLGTARPLGAGYNLQLHRTLMIVMDVERIHLIVESHQ